jgi:hypothetical protein
MRTFRPAEPSLSPSILAPTDHGRSGLLGPAFRPIATAALRSLALVAIALILILVVLPALLVAAAQAATVA